jgi:hypothetical protein
MSSEGNEGVDNRPVSGQRWMLTMIGARQMMRRNPPEPGDRFIRAGLYPTVWVVDRFVEKSGMPLHVRVSREDRPSKILVIAVTVLDDIRQFRRLSEKP